MDYIQNTLGLGKVGINANSNSAYFKVTSQHEIEIILAIFSEFNLNSAKHLDFLAFKQAFVLYMEDSNREVRLKVSPVIDKIRSTMNSKRTDFSMASDHYYNITPYWLLGFVEGDGSFIVNTSPISFEFYLIQKGNKALFEAIKCYLHNLAISPEVKQDVIEEASGTDWVKIYLSGKGQYSLSVTREYYIEFVIIPLFDTLTWRSKKDLDYCDWKGIFNLCKKGLHYLPQGKYLIARTVKLMNKTYSMVDQEHYVDRLRVEAEIVELLNEPSNYEIREGRIFILSLNRFKSTNKRVTLQLVDADNGNILHSFNYAVDCAKFLGTVHRTVAYRATKGNKFLFQGKFVNIQKA